MKYIIIEALRGLFFCADLPATVIDRGLALYYSESRKKYLSHEFVNYLHKNTSLLALLKYLAVYLQSICKITTK